MTEQNSQRLALTFMMALLVSACQTTDSKEAYPQLFETPQFELVDSDGDPFSSSRLQGHAWLANFIFTRCHGPCPLMSQKLSQVQAELRKNGLLDENSRIRLVSITVDPEYDTPEVLAQYSKQWNADTRRWHFLTGPPEVVSQLVEKGFKTALNRVEAGETLDIVHGTAFLLVGPDGSVRKILRMDDPDFIKEAVIGLRELSQAGN